MTAPDDNSEARRGNALLRYMRENHLDNDPDLVNIPLIAQVIDEHQPEAPREVDGRGWCSVIRQSTQTRYEQFVLRMKKMGAPWE